MAIDAEEPVPTELKKDITFYYPSHCRGADGHIYMNASFYTQTSISQGWHIVAPESRDYFLWLWIVSRLSSFERGCICTGDLPSLRIEFEQARQQADSPSAFHESLLAAVPICRELTKSEQRSQTFNEFLERAILLVAIVGVCTFAFLYAPIGWLIGLFDRYRKTD